jgi:hypothetical protein
MAIVITPLIYKGYRSRPPNPLRLILALFLLWACCFTAKAQVESGKIVGTVKDASGAVVADAVVRVTETQTNVERITKTDNSGGYVVTELKSGEYTVAVERQGFKKALQSAFKLDVNQVVRVDIALAVGSVSEEVVVTAAAPLIESETSSLGQVIEQNQVHDLPLDGRDFIELAYLTPGVNQGPSAGYTVQQGGIPEDQRGNASVQVNGLTATNNNFLLNGFDNNEQQIGIEVIQPSIDAIQEFKVQTNNFGADIGRGGAVVNVMLKSGANQFHGSLFEFLRNSAFDAKNYFDSGSQAIAPFKQNQFGGTFGGPIIKDKTFFFFDYQGTRIRQAQTFISVVPTVSERGGDFSDLLTGNTFSPCGPNPAPTDPQFDTGAIFDPFTNHSVPCSAGGSVTVRDPIPGNVIPACSGASDGACLDPAALNLVNLFPAPNRSLEAGNYLSNPVASNNQDSFDVRGDHQFNSKNNLSLTFSFNNVQAFAPDPFPGEAGGGNFTGNITNLARSAGISDVHTFAPDKINEFKIGYSRYVVRAVQNFAGQPLSQQLGIPGIFDPNNAMATGGLPNIQFSSLSPLGSTDWFPEFLNENNYQYMDAFTYVHGRHSFKLGADVRRRLHGFFQTQNARGDLSFNELFTSDLTTDTGGSALASFLMGYPLTAYRDGQKGSFGMRWTEFSTYLMDDFRVTPKLTLNLGVRYDIFTPPTEQENRLANFDFSTGQFVSPQLSGVSASGNVKTDHNNFAPRIGFAYTPWNDKTVVRGGFGIFYDVQADQSDAELSYNPDGLFFSQNIFNPATTPSMRISTGYPAVVYPTLQDPAGRASAALFNNRTTYIEEWNLNIERALSASMALQVAYVGTRGVKLAFLSNRNQPILPLDTNFESCPTPTDPSCATGAPTNFGRLYYDTVPNVGEIRTLDNDAFSISHGLQVKLEKRFSANWSMLNSYTWQHTIGQTEENEYLEPQDTYNLGAERGDNAPDFRHQFSSALSYTLPIGPKQRFWNATGPSRWLTEGWQLNGIVAMHSGEAFTPLLSTDYTNTDSGAPRPDIIGNPNNFSNATGVGCPSNKQTIECWYNPAAFAIPVLAPGQTFAHDYGDARRGSLRGPAEYNLDASLFKNFSLTEKTKMQFRVEAFNLFNTPEFGIPYSAVDQIGSPAGGGSPMVPSLSGSITSTVHASREIQLALKFSF